MNDAIELTINVPAQATDDEIIEIVRGFCEATSLTHMAHGGSGLQVDSVTVTHASTLCRRCCDPVEECSCGPGESDTAAER